MASHLSAAAEEGEFMLVKRLTVADPKDPESTSRLNKNNSSNNNDDVNNDKVSSQSLVELYPKHLHIRPESDANFIILNKPHDVRMDGYDSVHTIQNLLLQYYPSSTLENFKWIHQLDYSTSGILVIARNRCAANLATSAFMQRQTRKTYLALVEGWVDVERWEVKEEVKKLKRDESDREKGGRNDGNDYGESNIDLRAPKPRKSKYSTTHQKNQLIEAEVRDHNVEVYLQALRRHLGKDGDGDGDKEQRKILLDLSSYTVSQYSKNSKLRKRLRRAMTMYSIHVDVALLRDPRTFVRGGEGDEDEDDGSKDNERKQKQGQEQENKEEYLRVHWRLPPDHLWVYRPYFSSTSACPSILRIQVPIAEINGDFRCEIGHSGNPGSIAMTDLVVLEKGYLEGRKVTKVQLSLYTGRRHQLRVHCMAIGHPIVGDCVYNDFSVLSMQSHRCYLHAHR